MQDDTYISVVPVEYLYHTPTHPFCYEENCPCHTDADNLAQVQEDYKAGLLTAEEVDMIIKGKTL